MLFAQYYGIANFKVDFHNVHIQVKKDTKEIWYEFPYLVIEQDIFCIVSNWASVWLDPRKEAERDQARTRKTKRALKEHPKKVSQKVIIGLAKNNTRKPECMDEEESDIEELEQDGADPSKETKDIESPFIINKRKKSIVGGVRKM